QTTPFVAKTPAELSLPRPIGPRMALVPPTLAHVASRLFVEFGTSFGLSAIHISGPLRDNGLGRLVTTEQGASKAARAAQHLPAAGRSALVEIRQGDAFQSLCGIDGIDVLMLDGWKPLYLPLLRQLEPALASGCLIIADDVISHSKQVAPYLAYVRDV